MGSRFGIYREQTWCVSGWSTFISSAFFNSEFTNRRKINHPYLNVCYVQSFICHLTCPNTDINSHPRYCLHCLVCASDWYLTSVCWLLWSFCPPVTQTYTSVHPLLYTVAGHSARSTKRHSFPFLIFTRRPGQSITGCQKIPPFPLLKKDTGGFAYPYHNLPFIYPPLDPSWLFFPIYLGFLARISDN